MAKHRDFPIVESRVDWLTGTALVHRLKTPNSIELMEAEAQRVLVQQKEAGMRVEKARVLGFEGLKAGGVFYGRSNQGVMIRLSGPVAAIEWSSFYPLLSNVTRIDCAVTIRLDRDDIDVSKEHWPDALRYQRESSPKFKVVHIDGGKHGNSLLLGSRASESYARIYDKHKESGNPEYRRCWRYEVEFKKREALSVAHALAIEPLDHAVPMGIVSEWFHRRRITPLWSARAIMRTRISREVTDVERSLVWLRTQVGPTISRLLELGYAREVEKALYREKAIQPTRLDDAQRKSNQERESWRIEKWEPESK